MMIEVPSYRGGSSPTPVLFLLLILLLLGFPVRCGAGEIFPGYPPAVREQALRVVEVAGPGNEEDLGKEVRGLRRRMYSHGILSINAIPDLVFRRANQEGWENHLISSFRVIAEISPLSAPMWAWMVKEDILRLRVVDLFYDADGLSGALWRFGPALMGCAAWFLSFLAAAACWFAVWTSIALFLRARPSLESDIPRVLWFPLRDYWFPLTSIILFLLPLVAGLGLVVVTCSWMMFSIAYLRRGEMVLMTTAILLLAVFFFGGSTLHLIREMTGNTPREGWLGADGSFPQTWPPENRNGRLPAGGAPSWLVNFSRARAAMQAGNAAEAERIWTELVEEGKDLPEVRNNRGIARAKQGKMREALSDFEAAYENPPGDGAALWNAYQGYLQVFNLERARMIQPLAWDRVQRIPPFRFRPSEMEAGEWVASPLPAGELMRAIRQRSGDLVPGAGEGDLYRMFFRPLTPWATLLVLCLVWLSSVIWKMYSLRIWVHTTCRSCGSRTLVIGTRETTDFCNMCRAQVGWGVRAGDEKERRIQGIRMHRNTVRAVSVLVPGSGGLWSGKEGWSMAYAALLSLSLAGVTTSLGAREEGDIISALQTIVARWAFFVTGILWLAGAGWGIWSFGRMQRSFGISGRRG